MERAKAAAWARRLRQWIFNVAIVHSAAKLEGRGKLEEWSSSWIALSPREKHSYLYIYVYVCVSLCVFVCMCVYIYLYIIVYNLEILFRTYSDNISIIYTIKTSYTLRITVLLNLLALWKKDIKSSESRKSRTHSTKLTTALTSHVYSKMDFCPFWRTKIPERNVKEKHWPKKLTDFFFLDRNKLSAELQRVSAWVLWL